MTRLEGSFQQSANQRRPDQTSRCEAKTERSERSQEVIENKGGDFSQEAESQEVFETKGLVP
jgi:hypothetical protein